MAKQYTFTLTDAYKATHSGFYEEHADLDAAAAKARLMLEDLSGPMTEVGRGDEFVLLRGTGTGTYPFQSYCFVLEIPNG